MTISYTHNANGKTKTTGADSTTYVWDTQNRLTNATIVSASQTQQLGYEYNVEGMRTKSIVDGVETRYLLDENRQYTQVLEESLRHANIARRNDISAFIHKLLVHCICLYDLLKIFTISTVECWYLARSDDTAHFNSLP